MNTAQQAKNGFKTFLITFVVSLVVFGTFYYLISDSAIEEVSIEDQNDVIGYTTTQSPPSSTYEQSATAGQSTNVKGESDYKPNPFGKLVQQEVDVPEKSVLAGATQTTQSTVPETGVTSITFGLLSSAILFALFMYIVFINPRRYALSKFERKITEDLD